MPRKATYQQIVDGEPYFEPIRRHRGMRIIYSRETCCDCGLTHSVVTTLGRKEARIQVWREDRSTGQLRRYNDYHCKPKRKRRARHPR